MSERPGPDGRDDLRDTAETARRLAEDAGHDAGVERATAAGAGGHPHPQIRHADHLRAEDDVRTFERQEDAAEAQARAADLLEENAARLAETREAIADARETARDNRDDVRAIQRNAEALREQVSGAADAVRDTPAPDVR
ncbi:MAG TPA: hypothetical protein VHG91_06665 [Longimicrobium sp.]|nr:hypothetical protein [Longimicrobium sp.]